MWATPEETSEHLIGLYQQAWAHSDESLAETAQHAGHCDIVRELIDGRSGSGNAELGDAAFWATYVARIQAAADPFR